MLGVLIALAAQEAADGWSFRQDTDAAKLALREDFIEIVVNARERNAEDRCFRARLDLLSRLLDLAPGPLPALGEIGNPPGRYWYPVRWDSIVGTKVATMWPRDHFAQLGQLVQFAQQIDRVSEDEMQSWAQLYRLVGKGRRWTPEKVADMRAAIARAAYALNLMRLSAPQLEQMVNDRGLLLPADRRIIERRVRTALSGANYRTVCGPVGPVPAQRVTAPYDPQVQPNPRAGLTY